VDVNEAYEGFLRVRLSSSDGEYRGGLIPGYTLLRLMADCASEVGIALDGMDGFLARWENVDFLEPVYAGDWIEVRARLVKKGHRSRTMSCEVHLVVRGDRREDAKPHVLEEPVVVARGQLVGVAPANP